jgi:hypothetical protein
MCLQRLAALDTPHYAHHNKRSNNVPGMPILHRVRQFCYSAAVPSAAAPDNATAKTLTNLTKNATTLLQCGIASNYKKYKLKGCAAA